MDVPESLAALELLSWPLDHWCLSAMFLHLLLFGGLSLGRAQRTFSMFALLFTCAFCVSRCWTSSKVLVLCCSLLSKFTVWCVLSDFWSIFAPTVLFWPVGAWFLFLSNLHHSFLCCHQGCLSHRSTLGSCLLLPLE